MTVKSALTAQGSVVLAAVGLFAAQLPGFAKMPSVRLGDSRVKLEVASTHAQIERGLMYRTAMPEDHGMVFIFRPPSAVKFWMAHCFIALDMLMIKDGKIVKIFENVQPERDKPESECPTYPSVGDAPINVDEVVEVNAGYAKRHGIKEGDAIEFSFGKEAPVAPAAGK